MAIITAGLLLLACNDDSDSSRRYFPVSRVNAIAFDDNNVAWLGAKFGVLSFDGETWKTHDEQLYFSEINDLVIENDKGKTLLWIATDKGFTLWDISNRNNVSILGSLNELDTATSRNKTILPDINVNTIFIDANSNKWIGTSKGIVILKSDYDINNLDTISNFYLLADAIQNHFSVLSIDKSGLSGYHFIGTEGHGIARIRYNGEASATDTIWSWPTTFDLPSLFINDLIYDATTGYEYFGTDYGLAIHTGNDANSSWISYNTNDSLPGNKITAIAMDAQKNIWCATTSGLGKITAQGIYAYKKADGLLDNEISCIGIDNEQKIWLGTSNGISILQDSTFENHDSYLPTY